ncbi:hypothetical protein [Corynebacterium liangguodongii]|uniref:Uncharacterized protein n=1 Tax=Corynebacterium liangguodongii TaxID=2079535 RepID=A0A2S0WG85_9CORY|nr:hypothetical protein [Corynebacterium liangguodongii]AWB84779.1 hypothetical protein C3E79_10095 [Corynebacterium liangguodongii]PWB99137.1 hypothetical protein DF219_07710 [Corynebacterium liangguodongii]
MGSVEDDLATEWFTHDVVFHVGAGESPYGPSAGDDVPVKCHVRQQVQRVESPQGQQIVTDTIVYAPLRVMAERGDTLTLTDPFEPGPWQIIARSVHHGAGVNLPNHLKFVCDVPTSPGVETAGPYG